MSTMFDRLQERERAAEAAGWRKETAYCETVGRYEIWYGPNGEVVDFNDPYPPELNAILGPDQTGQNA